MDAELDRLTCPKARAVPAPFTRSAWFAVPTIEALSAVALPVTPSTDRADPCATLAYGRRPVTSLVRSMRAQVSLPCRSWCAVPVANCWTSPLAFVLSNPFADVNGVIVIVESKVAAPTLCSVESNATAPATSSVPAR